MARDTDLFSQWLNVCYSAVAGEHTWQDVVALTSTYVGTDLAHLNYICTEAGIARTQTSGVDPSLINEYLRDWAPVDPLPRLAVRALEPGRIHVIGDVMPIRQYHGLDVFEGLYERAGMVHQAGCHFAFGGGWFAMLSVANNWRRGAITPDNRNRLQKLVPHLRTALQLANNLQTLTARAQSVDQYLNLHHGAVVVCTAAGHIVDMTASAETLLSRFAGIISVRQGQLKVFEGQVNQRLKRLMATPSRDDDHAGPHITLCDPGGERALVLTVLPFEQTEPLMGAGDALRAVTIRECTDRNPPPTASLRHRFGLSRAQADVLAALMSGLGVNAIAQRRGSTRETIRSYLKTLLRKLDCHSQGQLIAKAWRMS